MGKHTCVALQHAVFIAIIFTSNTVFSSGKFKKLTDLLTSKYISMKNFYLAKAYKIVWNSIEKFFINKTSGGRDRLISHNGKIPRKCRWEITIRYVISTAFDCTVTGDACIAGCGAFCPELNMLVICAMAT